MTRKNSRRLSTRPLTDRFIFTVFRRTWWKHQRNLSISRTLVPGINGSGWFWVEMQLKSLSSWNWPQVYVKQSDSESQRGRHRVSVAMSRYRTNPENTVCSPAVSHTGSVSVRQVDSQSDRQAVSETANSCRVNIWFQSSATNKKCCVFISVWLQLSLTPPTVATAGCCSALSDLHLASPSPFLLYVASVCVNIWSPS